MKAVIFDLDGVLCHTDQYHYLAWKELANRLHIPFDEKDNDALRGVSRMASLDILLSKGDIDYTLAEKQIFAEEKNERYRTFLSGMTPADVSDDVKGTLRQLHACGIKVAVGSSSKNASLILAKTELTNLFDAIVDGMQITHSKPNPEVFLLAAKKLGEAPSDCMVVEDAVPGIYAAKNGGFIAVGIGAAACPETDYTIRNVSEIIELAEKK